MNSIHIGTCEQPPCPPSTNNDLWHQCADRNRDGDIQFWCGRWYDRTPTQLMKEAQSIITDLQQHFPEQFVDTQEEQYKHIVCLYVATDGYNSDALFCIPIDTSQNLRTQTIRQYPLIESTRDRYNKKKMIDKDPRHAKRFKSVGNVASELRRLLTEVPEYYEYLLRAYLMLQPENNPSETTRDERILRAKDFLESRSWTVYLSHTYDL